MSNDGQHPPQSTLLALRRTVDQVVDLQPDKQPTARRSSVTDVPGGDARSIIQLLLSHSHNSVGARTVFGALLDLLGRTETEEDRFRLRWMAVHGVSALAGAMLRHGACRPLMLDGNALLHLLQRTDRGKVSLALQTTLLPLLQALGQWKGDADVMAGGLAVLLRLSTVREGRLSLTVLDATSLVLHALLMHPHSTAVQAPGCAFLHNMALSPQALPRLWAAGAVEAVVAAVWHFPGDRWVLAQALPALYLLCSHSGSALGPVDDEVPLTIILRVGGVAAVVRAVDRHRHDLPLARVGAALLCRLSRAKSLRPLMRCAGTVALLDAFLRPPATDPEVVTYSLRALWRVASAGPYHTIAIKRLQLALVAVRLKLRPPSPVSVDLPRDLSPKGLGLPNAGPTLMFVARAISASPSPF